MTVGGQVRPMRPGDTILVQPREIHEMRNSGGEDVKYVVFGVSSGQNGKTVVVE